MRINKSRHGAFQPLPTIMVNERDIHPRLTAGTRTEGNSHNHRHREIPSSRGLPPPDGLGAITGLQKQAEVTVTQV